MTNIKNILSNTSFWQINKAVHLELGGDVALLLSDLSSRQDYWASRNMLDKEGYFFIERKELEKDTLLSSYKQNEATKILVKLKILSVKRIGIPPQNFYKLDSQKVNELVILLSENKKINTT